MTLVFLGLTILIAISMVRANINDEVPSLFNRSLFRILSSSMEKELSQGDIILIDTNTSNIKENQVITFVMETSQGKIINTHRVISVNEDNTYTTRGDNNPEYVTETVKPEDVIGVYVGFKIPKIGLAFDYLFSNMNIIFALIVLLAVVIIIFEARSIIKLFKGK